MLEITALTCGDARETLGAMSIHAAIRVRRERLGWSQTRLAEEVSAREGRPDRPLKYQTVQGWERESNGTAPPHRRLTHLADALGTTATALLAGDLGDSLPATGVDAGLPPVVAARIDRLEGEPRRIFLETVVSLLNSLAPVDADQKHGEAA